MPNSKTDTEILINRINERKNGMKKTAAILASIAAMSLCGLSASAADGDNIIDGVLNGAEEIVDGVVSGAEEIITPGGSTSVDESTNDSTAAPNCIITPHISWAPKESRQRIMDCTIENVRYYTEDHPVNVINN